MTTWADMRCPVCGGQTYGPIDATQCAAGHEAVSMAPAIDADWCGAAPPERAAAKGVQGCCAAPGHEEGGHVWWQSVSLAGGRHSAVWFYGQDGRVVLHADLRGGQGFKPDEAAAFYQVVAFTAAKRAAARTHTDGDPA